MAEPVDVCSELFFSSLRLLKLFFLLDFFNDVAGSFEQDIKNIRPEKAVIIVGFDRLTFMLLLKNKSIVLCV